MLLATRCPFCETVFRLQPAQLALRRGLVRCGHCQEVFDASSSLYEIAAGGDFSTAVPVSADIATGLASGHVPEDAAAEASLPAHEPGEPAAAAPDHPDAIPSNDTASSPNFRADAWNAWAPATEPDAGPLAQHTAFTRPFVAAAAVSAATHVPETARDAGAMPSNATDADTDSDRPAWRRNEPALADALSSPLPPPPVDNEPHFGSRGGEPFAAMPAADGADHFTVVRETRAAAPRRPGWKIVGILIALALLALLAAQLAWWQRETVMIYWPQSRPLYEQACARLGCAVAPPRDIDGLLVEPSDLRQVDGPHKLELKMPLRNRYSIALAYPAIELTLLDAQNNVAVRRVLWPQDYVKPGTPIAAGLPPRTTQTMIVRLDTGEAVASNFRVQIFYP